MVRFLVQGSAPAPYEVVVERNGECVTATCTCPAGIEGPAGQCCKHRLAILRGDTGGVVSGNAGDVRIVQGWIAGTDIEAALARLAEGEAEIDQARRKVAAAKRALGRVMSR
jgi:hypothetical protein